MSLLGCKALCIVINFLVLWSIYPGSFLVYFKNDLTRWTVQEFIPLMRFLLQSLVSNIFLIFLGFPLLFFILSPLVRWCELQIFPSTCHFSFLQGLWFFFDLAVLFLLLFIFFHFSFIAWHIFPCQIPFLYLDCIFLLSIPGSSVLFSYFENSLMSHVQKVINLF